MFSLKLLKILLKYTLGKGFHRLEITLIFGQVVADVGIGLAGHAELKGNIT